MDQKKPSVIIKILVVVSFLAMVTVNALANILPINGIGTGAVSDSYPNLFAPAGITFAIWGLIYILLGAYTLYHLGLFRGKNITANAGFLDKIGLYFILSSIANTIWIFSWHYRIIWLSMFLMLVILICLILVAQTSGKEELSTKEKHFVKLPFSVYFGWITVATIANATTLLVSIGWDGFGISEPIWTAVIIAVGLIIATVTMLKYKTIAYGLVIVWAYIGILLKHTTASGFDGKYPTVIITVIVSIVVLLAALIYLFVKMQKRAAIPK
jgi:hypothetical protein